jgi:LysM repeat protein
MKCRQAGSRLTVVNIQSALISNFIILPLILVSIFTPLHAQAGVFSWLFGTADAQTEEIVSSSTNSQNIALLQAVISPDAEASAKGDISIVGGTALLPETQVGTDAKNADEDQISIYVVHSGDTLPAIAKMFDVSVNTIRWANDLKGNTVAAGQTLIILPISGVQHTVKKGDTLQSIAKLYKGDLDEVMQYNNLSLEDKLALGDVVVVPDGEAVTVVTPRKTTTSGGKSTQVYEGYYTAPVSRYIKSQKLHGHNGVDLVCQNRGACTGTPIMAAASGQVIIARSSGYNGGYGLYVVIKHSNGTQTLYAHMISVAVQVGDNVSQGQAIGKMGSTGKSTGPHLHFEIRGAKNPF